MKVGTAGAGVVVLLACAGVGLPAFAAGEAADRAAVPKTEASGEVKPVASADAAARAAIIAAYRSGDFKKAMELAVPLAEAGHPEFQSMLGAILETGGKDVAAELAGAAEWYRKAAEQGNAAAKFSLSRLYFTGTGVAQDREQGERWLAEAMRQNYTPAKEQYALLKNKTDRLAGIGNERFAGLFLEGGDFPGSMTRSSLDNRIEADDALFARLAGLRGGIVAWTGRGPEAFFRGVDIRWTFPSAWTAKSYLERNREELSERLPPWLEAGDFGGEQALAFGEEAAGLARAVGLRLRHWVFLVRQGNVVAKLYLAADPNKQPELDKDMALAVAKRLAQRLRAAE